MLCDNDYGDRGMADAADCDINSDGQPDCGTTAVEDQTGPWDQRSCIWRNAVFDLDNDRPQYLGCYVDSEDDDGGALLAEGSGGDDVTLKRAVPSRNLWAWANVRRALP